jgi:hypothetical protein
MAMLEIDRSRAPELPTFDLLPDDQRLLLEIGANLLKVVTARVKDTAEARESALKALADGADKRAAEAISAAEIDIAAAQKREREAFEAKRQAVATAALTTTAAEAAARQAEQLAGQMSLLTADRNAALDRTATTEEKLARTIAQFEAEADARRKAEARVEEMQQKLATAQSELHLAGLTARQLRGEIEEAGRALTAASTELTAANERHARDIQDNAHLQAQLADQKARLDVAQVQLVERDRRITHLEAALASETARGTDLASQLRASQISTDQLAALRADVLSSLAESQKNNQRAEQIGAD